jgi:hypothetical protein
VVRRTVANLVLIVAGLLIMVYPVTVAWRHSGSAC